MRTNFGNVSEKNIFRTYWQKERLWFIKSSDVFDAKKTFRDFVFWPICIRTCEWTFKLEPEIIVLFLVLISEWNWGKLENTNSFFVHIYFYYTCIIFFLNMLYKNIVFKLTNAYIICMTCMYLCLTWHGGGTFVCMSVLTVLWISPLASLHCTFREIIIF